MSTAGELRVRILQAAERLRGIGSDSPRMEAEHLAAHALAGERRDLLLLRDSDALAKETLDRFEQFVERRISREPLQYILGTVPFRELELEVGPGVLIPRPETEVLIGRVLHWLRCLEPPDAEGSSGVFADPRGASTGLSGVLSNPPATLVSPSGVLAGGNRWIVDVGTGTGAILLGLLNQLPGWRGVGIDRSVAALAYASRNRDRHLLLRNRASLICGNLLAPIRSAHGRHSGRISAIVSNPPYIPTGELASLAPEVVDYEPRIALDGGEDGLDFVREILDQSSRLLEPGGVIALELALGQSHRVAELLDGGGFDLLEVFHDLTGRDRGVIAQKSQGRHGRGSAAAR